MHTVQEESTQTVRASDPKITSSGRFRAPPLDEICVEVEQIEVTALGNMNSHIQMYNPVIRDMLLYN